jgi:hypothetical protein
MAPAFQLATSAVKHIQLQFNDVAAVLDMFRPQCMKFFAAMTDSTSSMHEIWITFVIKWQDCGHTRLRCTKEFTTCEYGGWVTRMRSDRSLLYGADLAWASGSQGHADVTWHIQCGLIDFFIIILKILAFLLEHILSGLRNMQYCAMNARLRNSLGTGSQTFQFRKPQTDVIEGDPGTGQGWTMLQIAQCGDRLWTWLSLDNLNEVAKESWNRTVTIVNFCFDCCALPVVQALYMHSDHNSDLIMRQTYW